MTLGVRKGGAPKSPRPVPTVSPHLTAHASPAEAEGDPVTQTLFFFPFQTARQKNPSLSKGVSVNHHYIRQRNQRD